MGNHKLRRETGKKLKAAGFGSLYSVGLPKKHRPSNSDCKRLMYFLNTFYPGALVHDRFCNKTVKTANLYPIFFRDYLRWKWMKKDHWAMSTINREATYTDGLSSCGCSDVCESPGKTDAELTAYVLSCADTSYSESYFGPLVGQKMLAAIRAGAKVYDENGNFLPEWKDHRK